MRNAKKFPLRQRVIKIAINASPVAWMHLGNIPFGELIMKLCGSTSEVIGPEQ